MMIIIKKKVRKTWFLVTNRMLPSLLQFMFNDCSVCVYRPKTSRVAYHRHHHHYHCLDRKKMKQKIIFRSSFRLYGWVHIVATFEFFFCSENNYLRHHRRNDGRNEFFLKRYQTFRINYRYYHESNNRSTGEHQQVVVAVVVIGFRFGSIRGFILREITHRD